MRTLQENINQVNSDLNAIKAKIVEKGVEVADGTKTEEYAAKVNEVYEAGKKAEYDEFWDKYQQNGTRTEYRSAFYSGDGLYSPWDDESFKPKYDIRPTTASSMFTKCRITNLKALLERLGRIIDFSKATNVSSLFNSSITITHLPIMDFSSATDVSLAFAWAINLHTIDELILGEQITTFANAFNDCSALKNMIVKGTIKINGFDVKSCTKLTKASITSIINALSTTTSGLAVQVSKTAVNSAFETSAGAKDGANSDEWKALIATKTNWTITLA